MKPYPPVADIAAPATQVRMPRAPRLYAPGGTVHVVARCNNREFSLTTVQDFEVLLAHLRQMRRTYDGTLYAYTLMANHTGIGYRSCRRAPRPALDDRPSGGQCRLCGAVRTPRPRSAEK